jgi:septum formation protein
MVPDVDERAIRHRSPQVLTMQLAMAKSRALRPHIPGPAVLITSDQVVTCCGAIREKPENEDEARAFLRSYREDPAVCVTSVYGYNTEADHGEILVDEAKVWFKGLTEDAIDRIIGEGIIFACAGAFAVGHESFAPHINHIQGELESAMGLPKHLTAELIRSLTEVQRQVVTSAL